MTTPKAWLAFLVLTVIVGAVVAWSIMGKVSSYVQAEGIVLRRGGMIVDAASSTGGTHRLAFCEVQRIQEAINHATLLSWRWQTNHDEGGQR